MENIHVTDNPAEHRYELHLDGELAGVLDYVERDGSVLLTHAEVEPRLRGRGHGDRLVHDALTDLDAKGRDYVPLCPFVVAYLRRNAA